VESSVPLVRSVVEVLLQVETRGPEHCEHVKETLRGAGYDLVFS
jgi:hypothetical protein